MGKLYERGQKLMSKNLNPVDNFAAATDSKQTATLELTALAPRRRRRFTT